MTNFQVPAANRARLTTPDNRASAPVAAGALPKASPRQGFERPRKGNPFVLTRTTEDGGAHTLNFPRRSHHG
jgi:hypothetical protein